MKNYKRTMLITSLVILAPMIIGFILWNKLPNEIATHFDSSGIPDKYSNKLFTIVGIPLILLAVQFFGMFFTKKNFEKAGKKMSLVTLWLCPLISLVVMLVIYTKALGYSLDVTYIGMGLVSFITILVGNYLPKVKQNSTIGIKIPTTLKDEENWYETHRFAGKLWVLMGFAVLVATFIKINPLYTLAAWVMVVIAIPIVYSYRLDRNKNN